MSPFQSAVVLTEHGIGARAVGVPGVERQRRPAAESRHTHLHQRPAISVEDACVIARNVRRVQGTRKALDFSTEDEGRAVLALCDFQFGWVVQGAISPSI